MPFAGVAYWPMADASRRHSRTSQDDELYEHDSLPPELAEKAL